jgi:proline iminopeptidase
MSREEVYLALPYGRIWCARLQPAAGVRRTPMILLHGGPGAGADYLEPLTALADEREVVVYDQLGCGRSDCPDDASLWRVDRFVDELDEIRRRLDLGRPVLFGHSWGGVLALEYTLAHPLAVGGLILSGAMASFAAFNRGSERLVRTLSSDARSAIERIRGVGNPQDAAYQAAIREFNERYVCRASPWPPELLASVANLARTPVTRAMVGPYQLHVTGPLLAWDRGGDLGRVGVPTLVLCGELDEIVPECSRELAEGIRGAELVIMDGLSHATHNEAPDRVVGLLRRFLARHGL